MHAAQVQQWGQAPKYTELPSPSLPPAGSGLIQIKVEAAGLHRLVRSRASGSHYSVKNLPHTPGTDGVGRTPDGELVYFSCFPEAISGSFRELVNVPLKNVKPLPKSTDPIQAAGLMNPGLSSWMALRSRCQDLPANFSVLIMRATSASGKLAFSLARILGAKRVIGCARNEAALKTLGLDESLSLLDPA